MTDRYQQLVQFVRTHFPDHVDRVQMISGDASFRRYFRAQTAAQALIIMDAPAPMEDVAKFKRLDEALLCSGVRVPQILASDLDRGFLAIEDLGDVLLSHVLGSEPTVWYEQALALLPTLRNLTQFTELPMFDSAFVQRELGIFTEWFVGQHLSIVLTPAQQQLLGDTFALLERAVLGQPQVAMHRDFHSRNLMVMPDAQLAVIDFQDAVVGPICYDAVSLLRDCYVRWPDHAVAQWRTVFFQQLQSQGWYEANEQAHQQFVRDFDFTGLQRHLKVLGIFCRLHYRDQKSGYMADLPRVFDYVVDVASGYPELQPFVEWMQREVAPAFVRSLP